MVIETVFAIPGVGKLIGAAILRRDYPVMQGGMLFITALVMLVNILTDLLYARSIRALRMNAAAAEAGFCAGALRGRACCGGFCGTACS